MGACFEAPDELAFKVPSEFIGIFYHPNEAKKNIATHDIWEHLPFLAYGIYMSPGTSKG